MLLLGRKGVGCRDARSLLFCSLALLIGVAAGPPAAAQTASTTLDLNELGSNPAMIEVSSDYLTIIEFEGLSIQSAASGRSDQIATQIVDSIISIRANQEEVNTDLFVRVAGRTALFTLLSDPDAQNPKRYVVRDEQPPARDLRNSSAPGGLSKPPDLGLPPLPLGLDFNLSAYRSDAGVVVVQYVLTNNTSYPVVNDPLRLRVYLDGTTRPYERSASPVPGRAGRLSAGEAEYGQIVIPGVPANVSSLELEWMLVEIGPGTVYRAATDLLVALGEKTPDVAAQPPPTGGGTADTAPNAASTAASGGASAASADARPRTAEGTPDASAEVEAPETLFVSADFFDDESDAWWVHTGSGAEAEKTAGDSEICVVVAEGGAELWDVALGRSGVSLVEGQQYLFSFEARADKPVGFRSAVGVDGAPYTETFAQTGALGTETESFSYAFSARQSGDDNRLVFYVGQNENAPYRVCLDSVILAEVVQPGTVAGGENNPPAGTQAPARDPAGGLADASETGDDPGGAAPDSALVAERFEGDEAAQAWSVYAAPPDQGDIEGGVEEGAFCSVTTNAGRELWNVGVLRDELALEEGRTYTLTFDASADKPVTVRSAVTLNDQPWAEVFGAAETLSPQMQTYSYTFNAAGVEENSWLVFFLGGNGDVPYRVCFDNVLLAEADIPAEASSGPAETSPGVLLDARFEGEGAAQAWTEYTIQDAEMDYELRDGEACTVTRNGGAAIWDVGLLHADLPFVDDQTYTLTFDAYADRPMLMRSAITLSEVPWTEIFGQTQELSTEARTYGYSFEAVGLEQGGQLVFFLGGSDDTPYRVCFDNVTVTDASASSGTPQAAPQGPTDVGGTSNAPADAPGAEEARGAPEAVLVTNANAFTGLDALFEERLARLGFDVILEDDRSVRGADLRGVDLVLVSASVNSPNLGELFRDAAVPVVTAEQSLYGPLGMTGDSASVYFGTSRDGVAVQLTAPRHPLSAGLSGPVVVSGTPHDLAWGTPSPGAVTIATVPGDASKAAVFAYEAGAPMVGITAPGRRVALFHDDADAAYTDDAWALFDAAVDWASQPEALGASPTSADEAE